MELTQEIIDGFRKEFIWRTEDIGGVTYKTLSGAQDCRLFWMDFYHNVFAPQFQSQIGVLKIANVNTDDKVMICESTRILRLPPSIRAVNYYATAKMFKNPFAVNVSLLSVSIIYAIVILVIILVGVFVGKARKNAIPPDPTQQTTM